MAQWGRKWSYFERHWASKINLAIRVVHKFQALWVKSSDPFPTRNVIAILLNIFASELNARIGGVELQDILWKRTNEDWLALVGEPEFECAQLSPARAIEDYKSLVAALCELIDDAVGHWEFNVGSPTVDEVIQQILREIDSRKWSIIKYD
jgi:hypothetical protein